MRRTEKGFTLMELMVVIVIVAILAAVAVPLYINYVKDAQRTEAKGAIGAVITAEQTYFQQFGKYASDTFVANPGEGGTQTLNCDLTEAIRNWDISVTASGETEADGFVVTAVGKTSTPADKLCVSYTFDRTATAAFDPWDEVCAE